MSFARGGLLALRCADRRSDRPLPRRRSTTRRSASPSTTPSASSSRCRPWRGARSSCSRRSSAGAGYDRAAALIESGIDLLADLISAMHSRLSRPSSRRAFSPRARADESTQPAPGRLRRRGRRRDRGAGVASGEEPHLSFSDLDPWLVVFALGTLVMLGAAPYAIFDCHWNRERGRALDRALAVWGGFSVLTGLAFLALGALGSFALQRVRGDRLGRRGLLRTRRDARAVRPLRRLKGRAQESARGPRGSPTPDLPPPPLALPAPLPLPLPRWGDLQPCMRTKVSQRLGRAQSAEQSAGPPRSRPSPALALPPLALALLGRSSAVCGRKSPPAAGEGAVGRAVRRAAGPLLLLASSTERHRSAPYREYLGATFGGGGVG